MLLAKCKGDIMSIIDDVVKAFDNSFLWMVETVGDRHVHALSSDVTWYVAVNLVSENVTHVDFFDMGNNAGGDHETIITSLNDLSQHITI